MLLYHFVALMTSFPRTFIIKGNANNGRNPTSCLFLALMTPFPDIAFINEEVTDCTNEEAIDTTLVPRNPSSCFCFIFYRFSSTIN